MAGLFDKAQEFLKTDKGEQVSDQVLDKAAAAADKATGGKHTDAIASGRDTADKHLGTE
ncbi:Rv0909 family putative TA system antitoxin [Amnibacterium kyonggiense]|uniref:Antitoxin protein of toxin-antitoxin system n=1 Tax=Amnibacterium kyonggiense TaxID=595671 RepID=A0A4R7FMG1_9MICO|nr:Rv0909 family putative TA system antitoxin [Amnibacterium kyonggiense]TDS77606.1 antitoxin protein of toxin-antitoxin system [Amnibacterium kyonggiense]